MLEVVVLYRLLTVPVGEHAHLTAQVLSQLQPQYALKVSLVKYNFFADLFHDFHLLSFYTHNIWFSN